ASAQANRRSADAALQGTGGWVLNSEVPTMEGWLDAFGATVLAPDGETYTFSTTQTTQALSFLKDLADKSCAWSAQDAAPSREFAARQALFLAGSLAGLDAQAVALKTAGSKDDWTVIPFPSAAGKPVAIAYGPSFAVLQSNPEKQLAAWTFARWMTSPQNQARWIENTASLPLGAQVQPLLADYTAAHPQWAAALKLLPYLRLEPQAASWDTVRWSLSDACDRLFSPLFPANLIPQLVSMLNDTAAELAGRAH
ncbi:MAG TPA: extracellular solute-binding protein, partial [Anaerolineales bacterium]